MLGWEGSLSSWFEIFIHAMVLAFANQWCTTSKVWPNHSSFCECNQTLIFFSIWCCFLTVFFFLNLYFHRMHDATLMTCLLFDPCLKVNDNDLDSCVYRCLVLNFYLNFNGHIFWHNVLVHTCPIWCYSGLLVVVILIRTWNYKIKLGALFITNL